MKLVKYIGLILLLCSGAFLTQGQVVADFTPSKTEGCAPQLISFQNNSTPDVQSTTYEWDFGNGFTSTFRQASTSYLNPGVYSVKLTVRNGSQVDVMTKNVTILAQPVPAFTASDTVGCFPMTVTFKDVSTPASQIASGPGILVMAQ